MTTHEARKVRELERLLAESRATVAALLTDQIDAVLDPQTGAPVLLSEAQRALRESEERYRRIVETANEGIWTVGPLGTITFVNRRLADLLGYPVGEIRGRSLYDFIPAPAHQRIAERIERAKGGASEESEGPVFRSDGTELWLLIKTSPIQDDGGAFIGLLAMVTDRTRTRQDLAERAKLHSQLMVSDRMVSVGTLAAGIGHEINNPLAALMANLEFISSCLDAAEPPPAGGQEERNAHALRELRAPLADARDAAERVRVIVRDLKIFSRSPLEGASTQVDVNATLESSLRMAQHEIRHRARLVKDYGVIPLVQANEARLGQVFLNLVINAAQSLPDGRADKHRIRVRTRLEGGRVVVEVSDTGAGIPPELLGRIFDAFFTTKEVGVGTGLGLAISQRIISDLGGELTVESVVGTGSTFRVSIPVGAPHSSQPLLAARPPRPAGRQGRLLVVDDERLVANGVRRLLDGEHEVIALTSAREAVALCASGARFDVILCDLVMPEMTGMDLHRALSELVPEQAARMIFMTGGAFTGEAQRFLADGPKPYLQKPFDFDHLRALVRKALA
jgi:PAS domain S-box-containing protein